MFNMISERCTNNSDTYNACSTQKNKEGTALNEQNKTNKTQNAKLTYQMYKMLQSYCHKIRFLLKDETKIYF